MSKKKIKWTIWKRDPYMVIYAPLYDPFDMYKESLEELINESPSGTLKGRSL